MTSKVPSLRQEQLQLTASLRNAGRTWVEVARVFAERYRLNMRVALRIAHGWSQREAAERWNAHWPAEVKTFKNFSYWELWPARTGHAPSLDVLIRLAELYDCAVADLLADAPDYRPRDPAHQSQVRLAQLPALLPGGNVDLANGVDGSNPGDYASGPSMDAPDRPPDPLAALVERLEEMDVQDLARTVATWAGQVQPEMSRRALLVKLSAGLSLAAADPGLADTGYPPESPAPALAADMSGIWHSRYLYHSTGRDQEYQGEHYLVLRQQGNRLAGQSVAHSLDSRLRMHLVVDGSIATGTWTERTSPTGYYQGAVYHGTVQLIVNPMGRQMSGKWLGFGKHFQVNTGEWELTWVDGSTTARVIRQYQHKA